MNIDPVAVSQWPFAAFLIALGLAIAGLGWREVWVWGRERNSEREEKSEWRTVATKMTETNVVQAAQITQLAESVKDLTRLLASKFPS